MLQFYSSAEDLQSSAERSEFCNFFAELGTQNCSAELLKNSSAEPERSVVHYANFTVISWFFQLFHCAEIATVKSRKYTEAYFKIFFSQPRCIFEVGLLLRSAYFKIFFS